MNGASVTPETPEPGPGIPLQVPAVTPTSSEAAAVRPSVIEVPEKQPEEESKQSGRKGKPVQSYIDDELRQVILSYFATQKFEPSWTDFGILAFQEFLKQEGFWPPKTEGT